MPHHVFRNESEVAIQFAHLRDGDEGITQRVH
jgi:hypothetical protein